MSNVTLNRNKLIELGNIVSEILIKSNIKSDCTLDINVDEISFKKIDEDIFYRDNKNNEEFHPSEDKIVLRFHNLFININKE